MVKKEAQGSIITILLIVILTGIGGITVKSIYQYYRGPEYKIDCYINYLNQREYEKIYSLLSKGSTKDIGGKKEIEAYYKKIYERENKLVSVEKIGCNKMSYKLKYQYTKGVDKDWVTLTKEKSSWKIKFPFETSEVEVFAPLGSEVYLDSKLFTYNKVAGKYELNNVLPGTYLLKVAFQKSDCKDYYKAIRIPEEKSYEVPYETACIRIKCAPNLKVSVDQFTKYSKGKSVEFNDLLLADYKIKVEDENGYFETQEKDMSVLKGTNNFAFKEFKLTEKGKEKLNAFIEAFYNGYMEAINSHSKQKLATYFAGPHKQEQLNLFSEWYIDKKDIEKVKLNLQVGESRIDEMGQIHTLIRETSELYNKEYDTIMNQDVVRCYKVILDYETIINVLEVNWKVTDRKILQSLVSVQDQEGKWVQY